MKIEINEYKIEAKISQPVSFVFLSDLHDSDGAVIIDKLKSIAPDAVLIGGDFIHSRVQYQNGLNFIKKSSELFPLFAVLGNHEAALPDIRNMLKSTCVTLLDDSDTIFKDIRIGGLTAGIWNDDEKPNTDWLECFAKKDGYKLLLCHHPEYYEKYIRKTDVDLTLSGHAHGGQWRIFGRGVFAPGQGLFPKHTSGMYENRLIVSRGLGNKVCVPRINNNPEIILLKIC